MRIDTACCFDIGNSEFTEKVWRLQPLITRLLFCRSKHGMIGSLRGESVFEKQTQAYKMHSD